MLISPPLIYDFSQFQTFLHIEQELTPEGHEFRRSHSGFVCLIFRFKKWKLLFHRSQLQKLVNFEVPWSQGNGVSHQTNPASLQLYLNACKLLDLTMALPSETLPQFQMYRWAFVGEPCQISTPAATPSTDENKSLLTHLNNNHTNNVERSPSRSSSTNSSTTKSSITLASSYSFPFEPHVTRIEKQMRAKVGLSVWWLVH